MVHTVIFLFHFLIHWIYFFLSLWDSFYLSTKMFSSPATSFTPGNGTAKETASSFLKSFKHAAILKSVNSKGVFPCLLFSFPGGLPTGTWQWGTVGCCETRRPYWLCRGLQQLVGWNRAQHAVAKNVMWRSEQVRIYPKGYPSQDLCIISLEGFWDRFRGCGRETEARRDEAGGEA